MQYSSKNRFNENFLSPTTQNESEKSLPKIVSHIKDVFKQNTDTAKSSSTLESFDANIQFGLNTDLNNISTKKTIENEKKTNFSEKNKSEKVEIKPKTEKDQFNLYYNDDKSNIKAIKNSIINNDCNAGIVSNKDQFMMFPFSTTSSSIEMPSWVSATSNAGKKY